MAKYEYFVNEVQRKIIKDDFYNWLQNSIKTRHNKQKHPNIIAGVKELGQ